MARKSGPRSRTCATPASSRSRSSSSAIRATRKDSLERTSHYAIDLDPDFANFYPAVPYPGTELYEKAKRTGWLASEDWSRMEYLVLPAPRQRPGRGHRVRRDQSRQTPLLSAPGLPRAPRRRHREARVNQVEPRVARRIEGDFRGAGGRREGRAEGRGQRAEVGQKSQGRGLPWKFFPHHSLCPLPSALCPRSPSALCPATRSTSSAVNCLYTRRGRPNFENRNR